ncbi:MAG: recombination protein RecR [Micavibrio sp.]|nr:recombination protein RecR [Micavibrio sp.]|tara:strand:+ start:721 stop:1317 length:597 start_codon:yes stop_codon:yes gene_type:complete
MSQRALDNLIKLMSGLPGLGPRSARRAVLHLITKKETVMRPLARALSDAAESVITCEICGNLDTVSPCEICQSPSRDQNTLCVVESVADIWAIERAGHYSGLYHVLGGLLSAIDGIQPEDLGLDRLEKRIVDNNMGEVILALSATVNGQTTAHYISDIIEDKGINITGLARGIPVGGELDYLDDSTITTAFKSRKKIS